MISLTKFFKQDDSGGEDVVLPLLPLRDMVVFPHMVAPLFVGRKKSVNALSDAMAKEKNVFLATQINAGVDDPEDEDISVVGTIGKVLQLLKLPDGTVKALVEGQARAKISGFVQREPFFQVSLAPMGNDASETAETEALRRAIIDAFREFAGINKKINKETLSSVSAISDPSQLVDTIAAQAPFKIEKKQEILATESLSTRMELLLSLLNNEIEVFSMEQRIKGRVKNQMEKTQKQYYLNEQMRAIKKEMGGDDGFSEELDELEARIKSKEMSKEATNKVLQEFKKLKMMQPMSAEATVSRNYIDWLLALPWFEKNEIQNDVDRAEEILNEEHYGLEKPKERILEYLAVQSLVKKIRGPILCLVGPPGVGKTSLARSVAHATGREYVRLSLGGVRDEAEIRGHRRTYIGAMPGKIIQSLKKAGANNPVFCLDEVDKMSTDFRGDPSSALLEVLDPEQNSAFNDHYLDVDYDLSEILFITTANTLPDIPLPLQDRMEIIEIPGYTEIEKTEIAVRHLIPKQIEAHGLSSGNVQFSRSAVLQMIQYYTREAGVRNLERQISSICRKLAKAQAKSKDKTLQFQVSTKTVVKYLGQPKYRHGLAEDRDQVGIVTGLAWTQVGGELLCVEAVTMPGKGELIVTGKLGDVMKESARAAVSYVRSRSHLLPVDPEFYKNLDIHIHVPEGAIPKDGPSAGIAMGTAIVSALTRYPVNRNVAMTGEITLRGRVLPIGGLRDKTLAAHRGGIATVLIPKDNAKDVKDIPQGVSRQLKIIQVEHMDDVLSHALLVPEGKDLLVSLAADVPSPN